mgnify:CR=1
MNHITCVMTLVFPSNDYCDWALVEILAGREGLLGPLGWWHGLGGGLV